MAEATNTRTHTLNDAARLVRDGRAVRRSVAQGSPAPVVKRVANRAIGRAVGRLTRRLWLR